MSQNTEFAGQVVRALPDDLDPTVMQHWIDNPGKLRERLQDLLDLPTLHKVWRTITLGRHNNVTALRSALLDGNTIIESQAEAVMSSLMELNPRRDETQVPLVRVKVGDLKIPAEYGRSFKIILEYAQKRFGLKPCPVEVAPILRIEYADQPRGETLWIGTEPIFRGRMGALLLFVARDRYVSGVRSLGVCREEFNGAFREEDEFVFMAG